MTKKIEAFIVQQEAENQQRLKDKLAEQGRSPYLTLEVGENVFTLKKVIPTGRISSFGRDQGVFKVDQGGEEFDWPVTRTSPMYIKVVRKLKEAPVELKVVRTGTKKATRLDLKE